MYRMFHRREAADAAVHPSDTFRKLDVQLFGPYFAHRAESAPQRALLTVIDEATLADEDRAASAF